MGAVLEELLRPFVLLSLGAGLVILAVLAYGLILAGAWLYARLRYGPDWDKDLDRDLDRAFGNLDGDDDRDGT